MKILIVKPSSLGDVVHALPVLRLLRRQLPQSQIFWWIEASFAPLLEEDPDLTGVFIFHRQGWRRPQWWRDFVATAQAARHERFDLVIDLQGLSRSAYLSWLANGETTIGLDNRREGNREGAHLFYDRLTPRSPPGTSSTERYLAVLAPLGLRVDWDFEWLPSRPAAGRRVADLAQKRSGRWVALLPGARWQNKRWPVDRFAATVKELAADHPDLNFVILGAGSDRPLGEYITRANPDRCLDLTGQTSLAEMIEWLRRADLVIANDTGPLHVAAALRRPLVAVYGPSDPRSTGPHGQLDHVLQARHLACVPCMRPTCSNAEPLACLLAITPEQVCQRANARLER